MTDPTYDVQRQWEDMDPKTAHINQQAARIEALEAQVAMAVDALERVDEYLTRLQTPGSEPLNSLNCARTKREKGQWTATVRNEAREYWADLGNTLAQIKGGE